MELTVVQLSVGQLENIIEQASQRGAITAMDACGITAKEYRTLSYLYRKYGRRSIDKAIHEGQLSPCKIGKRKMYSEKQFNNLIIK